MDTKDFAQFLIKLDRNKAPVGARKQNKPVWGVETTSCSTRAPDAIYVYSAGTAVYWNGVHQWIGYCQWGDG